MHEIERCKLNKPDCFNCPYPDCVASLKDINRQQAYIKAEEISKRNKEIYCRYKNGETFAHLSQVYEISEKHIRDIIKSLQ